jgi:hypothetical protein
MPNEARYLKLVVDPIRVCGRYKPKFGQGAKEGGLSLDQFQTLYQEDAFYHWIGLDNPMMYAAHKAAGGMTSIYRQIGIGCEKLIRTIIQDSLGLSPTDSIWSYEVQLQSGKKRKLSLDARIELEKILDPEKRERFQAWMEFSAEALGVDPNIFSSLTGTVFEIRQGYKSKDSKRQSADIANAATAYTKAYLPCAVILSTQIDNDILYRYKSEKWAVLTGIHGSDNALISTYDFMRDVIGYDLAAFFQRNSQTLRREIDDVLNTLLTPGQS